MNRTEEIRPRFVEFIPSTLEAGILYISRKYKTASHLCCCGCANKVVTPLNPSGWKITEQRGSITLYPSIGNWSFPCQSHYWIRGNRVEWAPKWSRQQIEAGRTSDRLAREHHFDGVSEAPAVTVAWRKFKDWFIRNFFGQTS